MNAKLTAASAPPNMWSRTSAGRRGVTATRRHFSSEDKIRIVLDGLHGENSIAELRGKEGIVQSLYDPLLRRQRSARRVPIRFGLSHLPCDTCSYARATDLLANAPTAPGPPWYLRPRKPHLRGRMLILPRLEHVRF